MRKVLIAAKLLKTDLKIEGDNRDTIFMCGYVKIKLISTDIFSKLIFACPKVLL